MKLLPQRLNYALMWKCQKCSKWNREDADSCSKCALLRPILPFETSSKKNLIRMLDTLIAYSRDNGLGTVMPTIFTAVILALQTETEGYLEAMCRAFGMLHARYRIDGDRIMDEQGQWKRRKDANA